LSLDLHDFCWRINTLLTFIPLAIHLLGGFQRSMSHVLLCPILPFAFYLSPQHYPKTSKYISLYPSQTQDRSPTTHETTDDPRNEDEEPEHQPTDETSKKRAEIRKSVRKATKAGSMSAEPELYLEEKSDRTPSDAIDTIMTGPNPTKTSEPKAQSKRKVSHPELTTTSKTKKSLESVHGSSSQRVTTGVTGDDFFDIDED
jgi:hypothetical protein